MAEELSTEQIERELQPLLDCGLMMQEDVLYLSLATRLGEQGLTAGAFQRFQQVVDKIGEPAGEGTVIHVSDMSAAYGTMVTGAVSFSG